MIKKNKQYKNYEEWLQTELKNPKLALDYLNEALMDEDEKVFLIALKDVLNAQGDDAQETNISRPSIYRMLSEKGNPRWNSLASLFSALSLQMQLTFKSK